MMNGLLTNNVSKFLKCLSVFISHFKASGDPVGCDCAWPSAFFHLVLVGGRTGLWISLLSALRA